MCTWRVGMTLRCIKRFSKMVWGSTQLQWVWVIPSAPNQLLLILVKPSTNTIANPKKPNSRTKCSTTSETSWPLSSLPLSIQCIKIIKTNLSSPGVVTKIPPKMKQIALENKQICRSSLWEWGSALTKRSTCTTALTSIFQSIRRAPSTGCPKKRSSRLGPKQSSTSSWRGTATWKSDRLYLRPIKYTPPGTHFCRIKT